MNCAFEVVGGNYLCARCGRTIRLRDKPPKATCGMAGPPPLLETIRSDERTQLEAAAKESGMLLGDAIAALTTAIGIPPCGVCEKRKAWLNAAHRWFRDRLASAQDQPRDASG